MVSLLCKLATEVMQCVLQDIFFFWCFLDDKKLLLSYCKNLFLYVQDKNFVVYFYDHFHFL